MKKKMLKLIIDQELFDAKRDEDANPYCDENDPADERNYYSEKDWEIYIRGFKDGYFMGAAQIVEEFGIENVETKTGIGFF